MPACGTGAPGREDWPPHARAWYAPRVTTLALKLQAYGLFKGVAAARMEHLAQRCRAVALSEGDALFREGDPATQVLLIQRGMVQVFRAMGDGGDATVALMGPRECVGLTAVLESGNYPASARVVSPQLDVLMVDGQTLRDAMAQDLALVQAVNAMLLQHTHMLRAKINIMTAGEVTQRLAALFLHLAARFGDEGADGRVFIPIILTRRVLAGLVGAREETVIRALTRWEKEGVLTTGASAFELLNPQELRNLLA